MVTTTPSIRLGRLVLLAALVGPLAACGSSNPGGPSSGVTVTMNAAGITPVEVHIPSGGTVTFLNNDSRPHAMSSDPIQTHTDCPAINDVGFLNPGQRGSTAALTVKRTCGFHDHINENDATWKGRIVIE
jgi:plastocyanin